MELLTKLRSGIALVQTHLMPVLFVATAVVCFGLGWRQHGLEDTKEQVAMLSRIADARQERETKLTQASAQLEQRLAALEQLNRNINRRLYVELQKPVYRTPLPADGMRIIADAIAGRTDPGEYDADVHAGSR